jgi:tetratricopeptide (TPR) repeat protein
VGKALVDPGISFLFFNLSGEAMKFKYCYLLLLTLLIACHRSAQDYINKGDKFFAAGKYADAEINYSNAVKITPQRGEAYYKLGLAQIKQDKGVAAHQVLQRAVALLPKHLEAKVALADVAFAFYFTDRRKPQALYDEVARLTSEILAINPNSPDGFRLTGALRLLDLKPIESVEAYRRANELRPNDRDILLGYTQALFQSGRTAEAERSAVDLLRTNPAFGPIYDILYGQYIVLHRTADAEHVLIQWATKNPKDSTAVLRLARHYARLQKPKEMAAALQRMLDNPANFPQARMEVGDFYAGLGNWAEAGTQYERGVQADSKNAVAYRKKMVTALLAQGKEQAGAGMLDLIIKQAPNDSEARAARANLWLQTGNPEKLDAALAEFQALLKEHPDEATLHYNLGRTYVLKDDATAARARFLQAAQLRKDFLLPRLELAQIAISQHNPEEALRYAEEIAKIDPADPRGRLLRAAGLREAGRLAEAHNELRFLLKDHPQYRDAQVQVGLLAIDEKRFKAAEDVFRGLAEVGGTDLRPVAGLATTYSLQRQYDKAIQVLTEESKRMPDASAVRNLLATTAIQAGRYPLAIENFQRVLAASPKSVEAHVNLAEAYRLKGDVPSAIATLRKAKQLDTKDLRAAMVLAAEFYIVEDLVESRDIVQHIVQLQADNAAALNSLAFLMSETGGNLDEAQKLAERALRKDGKNTSVQDTLGWIYLKKGVIDSALQIFSNLVTKEPGNASFRYHFGAALLKKSDRNRARTELQAALASRPQPADERNIRELLATIN